nr:malto-oligosyltrehalose synthase [uncultured Pseudomonas sp.]
MTELLATARLQFHRGFTLDDAVPLVDYFSRMGITHLYASPLLSARTGSMHGYDVVDPTSINPELGGEAALERLVEALRKRNMRLILDIVSNHMAVGGDANPWWLDVLEWGMQSPYANFFDIDWQSPDPLLHGQLLVPFLRSDYGDCLASGEIELHFDKHSGQFFAKHYEHRFPLTPSSYGEILGCCEFAELKTLGQQFAALQQAPGARQQAEALRQRLSQLSQGAQASEAIFLALTLFRPVSQTGLDNLHRLLERQHYRLASWRTAADDINWRRFFDITELGGLRVERTEVFEATHAKIFDLIERGLIDGLRIDHIDGLANPRAYCRKLRRRVDGLLDKRPEILSGEHFFIFVEKILGEEEQLPVDWNVDGSTGYEFMNQVSLLQHDPLGELQLCALWSDISGRSASFHDEVYEARQQILGSSLAGDLETVAQDLLQIARDDIATRDLTLGGIRRALFELVAHFPVYRTYAGACGRSEDDRRYFNQAMSGARTSLSEAEWPILEQLDHWLGGQPLHELPPGPYRRLRQKTLARFQQLTSPTAAKSIEDTAFYRSAILLSRSDVGFDPGYFSISPVAFHRCCSERFARFPNNLLTTATHDHKRGEDVRARLAVISERADWFGQLIEQWRELAKDFRSDLDGTSAPSSGDELILYQTLIGSWPPTLGLDDQQGLNHYLRRINQWQCKALREAKLRSNWSQPDTAYESACQVFAQQLLSSAEGRKLRGEIAAAAHLIAPAGALNSLGQCLLRMTTPGVPDLYQGTEFWDLSLVDPDNRNEVDYSTRINALAQPRAHSELIRQWSDGRIKQHLISRVLALRAEHSALVRFGDYLPLAVNGEHAERVLAFARHFRGEYLIVIVPRLTVALLGNHPAPHIPPERWGDTRVVLPIPLDGRLKGYFSSTHVTSVEGHILLSEVLADFPVNLIFAASPHQESPQ